MGKVNCVVEVDESLVVSTSKDKGNIKDDDPKGLQDDDFPMSSHQGRGLYWGAMDYTQASGLVKDGAEISFNLLMWLVQEVQYLHIYDTISRCNISTLRSLKEDSIFSMVKSLNSSLGLMVEDVTNLKIDYDMRLSTVERNSMLLCKRS